MTRETVARETPAKAAICSSVNASPVCKGSTESPGTLFWGRVIPARLRLRVCESALAWWTDAYVNGSTMQGNYYREAVSRHYVARVWSKLMGIRVFRYRAGGVMEGQLL